MHQNEINSAIHRATGQAFSRQERPSETIPATGSFHGLWEFQELYQAKSWNGRNCEAGGFVNSAVTVLFTKPACLLPAGTMFRDHSPIHGLRDIFPLRWNSTSQSHGRGRNSCEPVSCESRCYSKNMCFCPVGPISFIFMMFSAKKLPNNLLALSPGNR